MHERKRVEAAFNVGTRREREGGEERRGRSGAHERSRRLLKAVCGRELTMSDDGHIPYLRRPKSKASACVPERWGAAREEKSGGGELDSSETERSVST